MELALAPTANPRFAQGKRTLTVYFEESFTTMTRAEDACVLWPKLPTGGTAGPFTPSLDASMFFANCDDNLRAELLHHPVHQHLVSPQNMAAWDLSAIYTALFEIEHDPAYKAAKKDRDRIAKVMTIQATTAAATALAIAQATASAKAGAKATPPLAPGHNPPGMGKKGLKKARTAAAQGAPTGGAAAGAGRPPSASAKAWQALSEDQRTVVLDKRDEIRKAMQPVAGKRGITSARPFQGAPGRVHVCWDFMTGKGCQKPGHVVSDCLNAASHASSASTGAAIKMAIICLL